MASGETRLYHDHVSQYWLLLVFDKILFVRKKKQTKRQKKQLQTDQLNDQPIDGQMDRPSYRIAWLQLIRVLNRYNTRKSIP